MQSAGETEEDDAEDEDWHPDSNELMAEMEEKRRPGAENEGGDSGEDGSEEEEEMGNGKLSGVDLAGVLVDVQLYIELISQLNSVLAP